MIIGPSFAAGVFLATLAQPDDLKKRVEDLERRLAEQEKLIRPGEEEPRGLIEGIHFFGYGEAHYNRPRLGVMTHDANDRAEVHRFVLGWAVELSDSIEMLTELDFEHGARELEIEYAYVNFKWQEWLSFRAGSVLMPVGSLNEIHEPPRFYSVERPYTQNFVIPTTWQEMGAGIFGTVSGEAASLRYRFYLVQGLDPSAFDDDDPIRGGRGRGVDTRSFADGYAITGRIEFSPIPWATLAASGYGGVSSNREFGTPPTGVHTGVAIWEADLRVQLAGADVLVEGVQILIPDADSIQGLEGDRQVAERSDAWYIEVAYDLLYPLQVPDYRLVLFARHEYIDTQAEVPTGFPEIDGNRRRINTIGIAFYPLSNLALKVDYEIWEDDLDRTIHRLNLGIGFEFHP